ncbi:hypothetical protein LTR41_000177 [Exophiala xenobiotica]|nr:hypothetical protein LTR41_000177 [Exophiala xenobiotica]
MDFKYQPLSPIVEHDAASVDSESTLGDADDVDIVLKRGEKAQEFMGEMHRSTIPTSKWLWLLHVVLLVGSLTLFTLAVMVRSSTLKHVREFSAWSPADTSVGYQSVKYNVSTEDNRFVGAGPEVDKAWREISYDMGDQWISKSDLDRLGMPRTSVEVAHPQTGQEGYRVGMEVFHQLHCLNLLRRVTFKEYYEPLGGEFAAGPEALQHHTDHCIEVLRLNIQCNADIGLFTLYMVEGDPQAWPQLNTKHMCRNFDGVRQWALDHSVGNMELLE